MSSKIRTKTKNLKRRGITRKRRRSKQQNRRRIKVKFKSRTKLNINQTKVQLLQQFKPKKKVKRLMGKRTRSRNFKKEEKNRRKSKVINLKLDQNRKKNQLGWKNLSSQLKVFSLLKISYISNSLYTTEPLELLNLSHNS